VGLGVQPWLTTATASASLARQYLGRAKTIGATKEASPGPGTCTSCEPPPGSSGLWAAVRTSTLLAHRLEPVTACSTHQGEMSSFLAGPGDQLG